MRRVQNVYRQQLGSLAILLLYLPYRTSPFICVRRKNSRDHIRKLQPNINPILHQVKSILNTVHDRAIKLCLKFPAKERSYNVVKDYLDYFFLLFSLTVSKSQLPCQQFELRFTLNWDGFGV